MHDTHDAQRLARAIPANSHRQRGAAPRLLVEAVPVGAYNRREQRRRAAMPR